MKWISFEDLKPPHGMYIFVIERGEIGVIQWDKFKNDSEFVLVYGNVFPQPREIYSLEAWAPISFFDDYIPKKRTNDGELDLKDNENWLKSDNPKVDKFKELTINLNKLKYNEMYKTETRHYITSHQGIFLREEIDMLLRAPTADVLICFKCGKNKSWLFDVDDFKGHCKDCLLSKVKKNELEKNNT